MSRTKTLYLLRGLPSSGKTTLAETLEVSLHHGKAIAADDYHYDENGNYNWKPENVKKAHMWCQGWVRLWLSSGVENVIVHNTFTTEKELKPYFDMAKNNEYKVVSIVVEKRHSNKNNHNVPKDVVDKMEKRLLENIKLS